MVIEHKTALNSALNGLKYKDEQEDTITVRNAVSGAHNVRSPRAMTARHINNKKTNKTILYTGRISAEGEKKIALQQARELIGRMFQTEYLKDTKQRKGITQNNTKYQFTFMMQSLLNVSAWNKEQLTTNKWEREILQELAKNPLRIPDPDKPRNFLTVRVTPIHFSTQISSLNRISKAPKRTSSFNKAGLDLVVEELPGPVKDPLKNNPRATSLYLFLAKNAEEQAQGKNPLNEEEILLCHILLARELNIPLMAHCKSNLDRTSIMVALAAAVEHWEQNTSAFTEALNKLGSQEVLPLADFKQL